MQMAKTTKSKSASPRDQELNRWCIEIATRWPTLTTYGNGGGVYGGGGAMGSQQVDADLLGRATKILNWIKTAQ